MNSRTKKILLKFLLTLFSGSVLTAVPFQQIIGEDVEFFVSIRNITELREDYEEHPMVEIFKDESLREWFDDFGDFDVTVEMDPHDFFEEMEDTFELSGDEFFELFPGQVSLAFYNISDQLMEKDEEIEFVFMAEFSGDAEKLDELMRIQFEHNAEMHRKSNPLAEHELIEETFMGETLYFDEAFDGEKTYAEDGYALVDGIFILAAPESRLRETVEVIKEGGEAAISDLETYQLSRDYSSDDSDVAFYVNLAELMPPLNSTLGDLPIFSVLGLAGVTPDSLKSALSLESMQGMFLDLEMVEDGILSHYGILYSEKAGLLSLFEHVEDDFPEARYVPDNVLDSSISLFDLSAMYRSLETILSTASPFVISMVDIQLQKVQTNTGVDLRAAMLENFGKEIVMFSVLKEDASNAAEMLQADQVFVIEIKDTEAFGQAVNAILDNAPAVKPLIEESTYEGETIYSIVTPNQPSGTQMEINYTITRSKFILTIGHISLLHNVLSEIGEDGDGFWQDPDTIALFERIKEPNPVGRSYLDLNQIIEPLFEVLAVAKSQFSDASESIKSVDVPKSLKGSCRLAVEANEAPGALFWRALIVKGKGEK